jgi:hypothetical protein
MRHLPASTDVNTEAEEATALEAVTRRQPAKIQQTGDFRHAILKFSMCELALAL